MKSVLAARNRFTILTVFAYLLLLACLVSSCGAHTFFPEYQRYTHTYLGQPASGNWTYLEKPMFPVVINESQISVGQNWSIVAPLETNHSYHAYCYGKWINNGSDPKTDYDVYVYNSLGEMETYHTEAAGLPEHLGTTPEDPFFSPEHSGNYTFVIRNDPRESKAAQNATFMIVENVQCNVWHSHFVEGKDESNQPVLNTSWAYEFQTESQHMEVWVRVPDTLDMYEARLYLMADLQSKNKTMLNDVLLAWEPGLYGDKDKTYGGYNLESKEYRGQAYASCEDYGQDMFLNFTSPNLGKSLYHLVLIGEAGYGTIEFLVKTEFGTAGLKPLIRPTMGYPQNETTIAYLSNSTDLANATFQYSINSWRNETIMPMEILDNRTCQTVIPGQEAGTIVKYKIEARDVFENVLTANGTYPVKYQTTLNITLVQPSVVIGQNITVKGKLMPEVTDHSIVIVFSCSNITKQISCQTMENGEFTASFRPETLGTWRVQAKFNGDQSLYDSTSLQLPVRVEEPSILVKYSLYIGGVAGGVGVAAAIVYVKKFRQ